MTQATTVTVEDGGEGRRLGAATALGMCAETLAREPSLQGHVPHVLKGGVEALRAAARDPPGSGAAAATIDAIKVRR